MQTFDFEACKCHAQNLYRTLKLEQKTNTIGVSWKHRFKNSSSFIHTVLSNNRLQNTFTRFFLDEPDILHFHELLEIYKGNLTIVDMFIKLIISE